MNTDTDNLLYSAIELIKKEDFENAKNILSEVVKLEPSNSDAYKNLGLCEINLDNNQEALLAFRKAYELNNQDATTTYYYACCLSKTDKQKASIIFREVINLRNEYLDAYKSLAMMYIEMGQLDSALETVLSAINNDNIEKDYSIYYICATICMLQTDYKNAIEYLNKALASKPDHLPVLNSLATCYMNVKDYKNAKINLQKAYELDPKDALTLYNLGICHQTDKEYREALKYFQEAYNIEPSVSMLSSLAYCTLKCKEYNLACSLYNNLVSTYPNNVEYRYSYIEALEEMENYEGALENVEKLLEIDTKNVALAKKKGTYLRKLRRNEESIETFQKLLNRGKIDIEVYYNLAFNYTVLGEWDNAKEMFKKCIILEPNNPYAHKDLGVLYLKMNCYDWAVDEMKEAIKLEDNVSEFHYSLGVSYMMLSEVEKAKEAFLRAIELDNNNADSYAYLGYVYMLERSYEKAAGALKQSLKINPDNFLAKSHSAKLFFQMQKYEIAREFLSDIIEKIQDDETVNMLGVCHMELKEYEKAIGLFYKLAKNYPQNHIILYNLAKCEHECNKDKEAIDHLRQALMVYDDWEDALKLLKEIEKNA